MNKLTKLPLYAVSMGSRDDDPKKNCPMWVVRGGDPKELAALLCLTEFGSRAANESVGAYGVFKVEDNGAVRFTVHYQRNGGAVPFGRGDADVQVYVHEIDETHMKMWTGPGFHGTYHESIEHIEYGGSYREVASLAVHEPEVLRERVAGRAAIAALAGEDEIEQPAISRVGWLETLLDEIDASPEAKAALEGEDPESFYGMLHECRKLVEAGKKVVRARHEAVYSEPEGDPDELPVYRSYPRSMTPPPEPWVDANGDMPF